MNVAVLHGRITKDPELKFAAGSGMGICKFTLAVNRMKKDEADFINCIAFGKNAENIAQYFKKGSPIVINGHIQTGSYDAQDGTKRYTTDVVVDRFDFVSGSNNQKQDNQVQKTQNFDDMVPVEDDMMPF